MPAPAAAPAQAPAQAPAPAPAHDTSPPPATSPLAPTTPVAPRVPVDLSASVATIAITVPSDGVHVHECRWVLVSGRFVSAECGPTPSDTYPLNASSAEALLPLLVAVDDWGTPQAEADPPMPITITLYGDRTTARFGTRLEDESPRLAAFRLAALAAAQEGLTLLRERAEACDTCAAGEYCAEVWQCSTTGPDKNCERVIECSRSLPATSRCLHHYECASGRCDGAAEVDGHCG